MARGRGKREMEREEWDGGRAQRGDEWEVEEGDGSEGGSSIMIGWTSGGEGEGEGEGEVGGVGLDSDVDQRSRGDDYDDRDADRGDDEEEENVYIAPTRGGVRRPSDGGGAVSGADGRLGSSTVASRAHTHAGGSAKERKAATRHSSSQTQGYEPHICFSTGRLDP